MRNLALLLVAMVWPSWGSAQVVEYYHLDALGSVRAITSQAGAVIERHDYLPFGEEHAPGLSCPSGQPCQRREFTGKERDVETGQDYFGARYYGSKIGRFTTVDPVYTWQENLLDPQRWNRYAYARNNPLRYKDPDGRVPVDTIWDVGNVLYDIYTGVKTGNWTDLGADALAAVIPYVPAGASKLRHLNKLDDAADLLKAGDKGADAARVVESKAGKRAFSTKDRDAAFEKAKDADGVPRCEYCEGDLVKPKGSPNSYEADHRNPWVKSRDSSPENLASTCRNCNREKGAKTLGDQWIPPKDRQQ